MPRPVFLIHDMWCTGANWARVAELLADRGYPCRAPTLPAHEIGVERPEVGKLSLRDYVDFLEHGLRTQGNSQAPVLIGHSMGGLLAQLLAVRVPPFALALLTPAPPAGIIGISRSNLAAFSRALLRPGFWNKPHKPGRARASVSVFNRVPLELHADLYAGLVPESGRALFEIGFWWADPKRASRVDAAKIHCPVHVVSSGEDKLTPAPIVRKVAALYPNAALRHYPERGHWVVDDGYTEDMIADLASWLDALERRAARKGRTRS